MTHLVAIIRETISYNVYMRLLLCELKLVAGESKSCVVMNYMLYVHCFCNQSCVLDKFIKRRKYETCQEGINLLY